MTVLHFATCDRINASKFLEHPGFNYLTDAAKEFVLDNLCADGPDELRVLDPAMHKPALMMISTDLRDKIKTLCEPDAGNTFSEKDVSE